jgi:hypothetical protein
VFVVEQTRNALWSDKQRQTQRNSTQPQLTGLFTFFFFLAWIFKRLAFLASITLRLTAKVRLESVQMRGAIAVAEFVTPRGTTTLLPTLNCVNCLVSLATEEDNIVQYASVTVVIKSNFSDVGYGTRTKRVAMVD